MEVQRNPEAPHRSVIWVRASTHELLKTGECSGMSSYEIGLFPLYVDGMNLDEAVRKLNDLLAEVKESCKKK